MNRCDFRSELECACTTNECRATPKQTPAPVIFISWRTQAATCLFIGALAGIIAFAVAGRAEPYFKKLDLIAQESRHG